MKLLQLPLLMLAAIACLLASIGDFSRRRRSRVTCCNDTYDEAVETHEDTLRRTAEVPLTLRHLLVKKGTGANQVAICTAATFPLGTVNNIVVADDGVTLLRLGGDCTRKMVASGAIALRAGVYTDAAGKVQTEPTVAGTYYRVGHALSAAGADEDILEVETCHPIKLVVLAALTAVDAAASGAADLAALKVATEAIGDDLRRIAAAFATPALVKILP